MFLFSFRCSTYLCSGISLIYHMSDVFHFKGVGTGSSFRARWRTWRPIRSKRWASKIWSHFLLRCALKLLGDSTFPLAVSHGNPLLRVILKVAGSESIPKLAHNDGTPHFSPFLVRTAVRLVAAVSFVRGSIVTINITDAGGTDTCESAPRCPSGWKCMKRSHVCIFLRVVFVPHLMAISTLEWIRVISRELLLCLFRWWHLTGGCDHIAPQLGDHAVW